MALAEMGAEKLTDIKLETKQEMLETLKQIGSTAVPALIQLLAGDNHLIRRDVSRFLADMDPSAVDQVPALTQLLEDQSGAVRNQTAKVWAEIGVEAVPALIQALKDENRDVRLNASEALDRLKNKYSKTRCKNAEILQKKLICNHKTR